MEYTLSELKKKTVVNIKDGKKLGKITDIAFCFPSGKITVLTITPQSVFCADKIDISLCNIDKIGEDIVLVKYDGIIAPKIEESEE